MTTAVLALTFSAAFAGLGHAEQIRIGAIDFFGTGGVDVAAVRAALPVKPGDSVEEADLDRLKARINASVKATTGRPLTDLSGVCCDSEHGLLLYIGLAGRNAHAVRRLPAPTGTACLLPDARKLYDRAMEAMELAVHAGDTGENHSRGYALSDNAEYRARQLAMRKYALAHAPLLETVLQDCGRVEDRQAAAHLLGYADQSRASIRALVQSSHDADAAVRNNAIRALWVIADSKTPASRQIPAEPFVAMLNSETWEDRNKAGLLLSALTEGRDPALLRSLRREALDSLVEMARWQDRAHADAYRVLLGRMAGIDEAELMRLVAGGRVEDIIAAALAPK